MDLINVTLAVDDTCLEYTSSARWFDVGLEVDFDINLVFDINFESVLPLAIFLHDANIVKRFNIQQTDKT